MRASPGIRIAHNASPELVALAKEVARYINDLRGQPWPLASFTVANALLLDASLWTDCSIIVKDETGGRTIATSDGTAFKRVKDGATVS